MSLCVRAAATVDTSNIKMFGRMMNEILIIPVHSHSDKFQISHKPGWGSLTTLLPGVRCGGRGEVVLSDPGQPRCWISPAGTFCH